MDCCPLVLPVSCLALMLQVNWECELGIKPRGIYRTVPLLINFNSLKPVLLSGDLDPFQISALWCLLFWTLSDLVIQFLRIFV